MVGGGSADSVRSMDTRAESKALDPWGEQRTCRGECILPFMCSHKGVGRAALGVLFPRAGDLGRSDGAGGHLGRPDSQALHALNCPNKDNLGEQGCIPDIVFDSFIFLLSVFLFLWVKVQLSGLRCRNGLAAGRRCTAAFVPAEVTLRGTRIRVHKGREMCM